MVRTRRVQSVSTLSQRKRVTLWMIQEVSETGTSHRIASRAISKFKSIFNQTSSNANRAKARDWWLKRDQLLSYLSHENEGKTTVSTRLNIGNAVQRLSIKARKGRGRKRKPWVLMLQESLLLEYQRLKKMGVQMSKPILKQVALQLVLDPAIGVTQIEIELTTGKSLVDSISDYFITDFCNQNKLVSRKRTGNLTLSPEATLQLHKEIAYHLGCMKRDYDDCVINECDIENYDETSMCLDMTGGFALEVAGKKRINWSTLSSGRESFSIAMRISGGPKAKIETPFVVFQNVNSSYPINGIPDNTEGVTYRSNPRGYMNQNLFAAYFRNTRIIQPLPDNRIRKIWIDSPRVHNETPNLLQSLQPIRTELKRFMSNATTLSQPLDQYLLRIFKAEWRKRWEMKRAELAISETYTSTGRLTNPGKLFFLQLVKDVVTDLNQRRTDRGITLARESLICTGIAPDIDGIWKVSQLTKELQSIVNEHLDNFNGLNPFQ